MSRKEKKKQKKRERLAVERQLNGWNCPGMEIYEQPDLEDNGNNADEMELAAADKPQENEQLQLDDILHPRQVPEQHRSEDATPPLLESQPVVEPRTEEIQPAQSPETRTEGIQPAQPPETRVEEIQPAQPPDTRVEEMQPAQPPETRVEEIQPAQPPETRTEEMQPAQPPETRATVPADPQPKTAERITAAFATVGETVTGKTAEAVEKIRFALTRPRKSEQELEEDQEKFGGLEDDEPQESKEPAAVTLWLAERKNRLQQYFVRRKAAKRRKQRQPAGTDDKDSRLRNVYEWAFYECYYIGVQLIRNCSDMRRTIFRICVWVKYTIPPFFARKRQQLVRLLDRFTDSCLEPFRDINSKSRSLRYYLAHRKEFPDEGKGGPVMMVLRYLGSLGKPINRIANFLLPILGCAVLAAVILYFQQINYVLEVEYSGMKLGYIARESDFYDAKNMVYERLLNEEYVPPEDSRPKFRLVIASPGQLMSTEYLANRIMAVSQNDVTSADGIYVDNAFLGAVENGSEFLLYIDSVLQNYRTETEHELVQFVKNVTVQKGIYPKSSLRQVYEIRNMLENNETMPQNHVVAEGETLETIAEANNTTVEDIISLNAYLEDRSEAQHVQVPAVAPGENVLVRRVELSLGIQVTRREVYTEPMDFAIDYQDDNRYPESYRVVISNGIKGEREVVADITYIDGERVEERRISTEVIREPVNARQVRGTLKPAQFLPAGSDTSASFIWPVDGGYVSAGLYGYAGHTGMDIAAPYGTAIRAARSGTVTYASNIINGAYGRRVDISHGNGVMTRYAHCSQVLVSPGQYVEQGQLIALVGRTGNASGNHCHLEIKINGYVMNPADFIGRYYPGR